MKLFVKIVTNNFKNQSRDLRELSVVSMFKTNIIVVAKGEFNSISNSKGYIIHKRTTRPLGNANVLVNVNRIFSLFTWSSYVRSLKSNYISCHDLLALFIGWLSTLFVFKEKKPLLFYDAHEFEIGRNTGGKRNKFMGWVISRLEKFLINRSAFSIMVNDSIADEVQKIYRLKERPVVVRNIPNYWKIDESICMRKRKEICEQLKIADDTFIVMYHGGITQGRGIENLLEAIQKTEDTAAVILGYGETAYLDSLKQQAEQLRIINRILFYEAVPIDSLWQYVGAVNAGMITIPPMAKSYYFMLPNKFFETIQSLTPVICSDFPETSKIVKRYDIGILVNPENVEEIAAAMIEMKTNKEMYNKFKKNLKQAKEDLCWENESQVLEEAYARVLG